MADKKNKKLDAAKPQQKEKRMELEDLDKSE